MQCSAGHDTSLWTKYNLQCTVYSVQSTVYSVHCKLYRCTVYSVQCTVYSFYVQCTVYSEVTDKVETGTRLNPAKTGALYTLHCTHITTNFTVHTAHIRLNTSQYTLHTVKYTFVPPPST